MRKVIRKRVRHAEGGTEVVADLQAVVVANVDRGRRSSASVSTRQSIRQAARSRRGTGSGRDGRPDPPDESASREQGR